MDAIPTLVLKENYTFLVADRAGGIGEGEQGLYDHDTRFLSRYRWTFEPALTPLLAHSPRPDRFRAHQAQLQGTDQRVGVRRDLRLGARRLDDELELENTSLEARTVTARLALAADFQDLFETRGWFEPRRAASDVDVQRSPTRSELRFRYRARDGLVQQTRLRFDPPPERLEGGVAEFRLALAPGTSARIRVVVELVQPVDEERAAPSYQRWRDRTHRDALAGCGPAVAQASDDLRSLLLVTEDGPVPAAGIPWFVAAFGRDALLTAHLLLPWLPELAEGTLRYLARHQARREDPFRAAEPGKIPHEIRFGELSRTGTVPHAAYYGTVDATPLFVGLVAAHADACGDDHVARELRPAWEAALAWMTGPGDVDGDGFLEFRSEPSRPGTGLTVQSWKDSPDSMSHADGRLAEGAIAVSEVQGYAYAAYRAAAALYRRLGDEGAAARWQERAATLQRSFHERFWLPSKGTYAMALDGAKAPLAVRSSDAGQLLWSGIVPEDVAPRLVDALFDPESYSGWGFRTLGSGEVRYNPISYHNGSVWPHDSALIAAGLERYGFRAEARRVARALLELANGQPDHRLPELVSGYPRDDGPPVPCPVACRPQAWDAAAILHLARLLG